MLAVGAEGGLVTFYDPRQAESTGKLTRHRSKVHGLQWSPDGNFLASGDQDGIVYIWDARAGKILSNDQRMGGRIKHGAPVKVSTSFVFGFVPFDQIFFLHRRWRGVPGSQTYSRLARCSQMERFGYSA